MQSRKRKRIIFLDMMRALAVLMMVEGHTVDAFLSDSFRNFDSLTFNIWFTIRGFTAPIFMFTSGVAFTYLLRMNKESFFQNPRVYKGFFRFLTLVIIGYLLRYPTYTFFNFSEVTDYQWYVFFTVDALHLIGFGLLFILFLSFIAEKLKLNDSVVFTIGAVFFFGLYPVTEQIPWTNYLPIPFAAYFYHGTGSFFPFFPWAGYVISGAILGSYIAKHSESVSSLKFSLVLISVGAVVLSLSAITKIYEDFIIRMQGDFAERYYIIFVRLGTVVLLNGIMSFIALKLESIPDLVKQLGSNTLLIYAVHIIIIYGSAWVPGFYALFHHQLDIIQSGSSAAAMIALMIGIVILLEKYKLKRKNKLSPVKI